MMMTVMKVCNRPLSHKNDALTSRLLSTLGRPLCTACN